MKKVSLDVDTRTRKVVDSLYPLYNDRYFDICLVISPQNEPNRADEPATKIVPFYLFILEVN